MWWLHGKQKLSRVYQEIASLANTLDEGLEECEAITQQLEEEISQLEEERLEMERVMEFGQKFLGQLLKLI